MLVFWAPASTHGFSMHVAFQANISDLEGKVNCGATCTTQDSMNGRHLVSEHAHDLPAFGRCLFG